MKRRRTVFYLSTKEATRNGQLTARPFPANILPGITRMNANRLGRVRVDPRDPRE